jgi:hypothetical protein
MTSRYAGPAGRLLGGIATAGALVLLVPGQAVAAEQPVPPTASAAPAPVSLPVSARETRSPEPSAVQDTATTRPTAEPRPSRSVAPVPADGQVSRVPVGAPDTGATDTGAPDGRLLAVGALGLAGAAGAAGLALHRRRRETPGR